MTTEQTQHKLPPEILAVIPDLKRSADVSAEKYRNCKGNVEYYLDYIIDYLEKIVDAKKDEKKHSKEFFDIKMKIFAIENGVAINQMHDKKNYLNIYRNWEKELECEPLGDL